ncbi:ribonuclease H-like domain-containing protein [Paenibacillus ginsengarvi]|uniref:YprB ribonuclease H-like domain-containing protein n=1 Tax=Paenibacillus ginsengarvi TaxID=400777 RepID=A0A3B0CIJ9_9BACL|nr:ribonuclease H-like domain-containing protein [Paenibacillus ginsengarvi]RKN84139.1 hypothetical protein D7M11_14100 [Paenibacillus ginsengarvi]
MSSLKERLGRLKKSAGVQEEASGAVSRPPEREKEPEPQEPAGLGAAWERLDATMQHNDWGQFIMRSRRYPLQHAHGTYRLGELCGEAEPLVALAAAGTRKTGGQTGRRGKSAVAEAGADLEPYALSVLHGRLLFLDTETTGLGVGAGNVAFMIGIGFYEQDCFVVEQLFIRNPAEEAAMLQHLRQRMEQRDMLVSYNGKCFDWPILKNRYILNRQKEYAVDPVHFDFLYPSRSLWRNTLPSCRLSMVEKMRLGLSRLDDVPGSLAPALYFQYLAEGDPALLAGVFDHNEMDVLTLACLAAHFAKLLQGEVSRAGMDAEELYRLALWFDKLGRADEADEVFRELLDREAEQAADYWLPVAEFYKRQGRYSPAISLWEKTIERKRLSRMAPLVPYIELAMFYEHRDKNYEQALAYAEQALERARERMSAARMNEDGAEDLEAVRKRVERLQAKRDAALRKGNADRKDVPVKSGKKAAKAGPRTAVWQELLPIESIERRNAGRTERRAESR